MHETAMPHPSKLKNCVTLYKHYLQSHGTAMATRTRMAPSYANIFLAKFETAALKWACPFSALHMVALHSDLDIFTSLNDIHPTIKFPCNNLLFTHVHILSWCQVNVSHTLQNGNVITDLYTKPTDKHQHLLHLSSHPGHTYPICYFFQSSP